MTKADLQARLAKVEEALRQARWWHESEDKALGKQPPGPDRNWRRMQHQEQMQAIDDALAD